ncbi:hypothetical protein RGI145_08600 [Roseomonas gilardii]|uniref:Helix-turn-helix domain-containing protein n=2 Tax=Roseomonas gilardii TaxID=257708 RepID=A0A1L7AKC8_9PROT|nr:hypothetical protein RGI145_08600 [Roseomonas gilardii]
MELTDTPLVPMLLREAQVAELLGLSRDGLRRLRIRGSGPPYIRLGDLKVAYRREDIEAWLNSRTFRDYASELAESAES